jgi:hypothetical protein
MLRSALALAAATAVTAAAGLRELGGSASGVKNWLVLHGALVMFAAVHDVKECRGCAAVELLKSIKDGNANAVSCRTATAISDSWLSPQFFSAFQ